MNYLKKVNSIDTIAFVKKIMILRSIRLKVKRLVLLAQLLLLLLMALKIKYPKLVI